MTEPKIVLNKKNDMDLLIKTYPNISDNELLKGGCYILKMKNGSVISFDCRTELPYKSWKLRGKGLEINPKSYNITRTKSRHFSKVATRHIVEASSGVIHNEVQTLYLINDEELESFHTLSLSYEKELHEMIKGFPHMKGIESENRYFCTPNFDVIVNVKPNGYELNPTWCKASAAYDAEEELSLISPDSTGFTWWYYPGRMYFSRVKWTEISKTDYKLAKTFILDKEQEIYNMINTMVDEILIG